MNKNSCFRMLCNAGLIAVSLLGGTSLTFGADDLQSGSKSTPDLSNARESIAIGRSRLRLTAYVWRNYMPMGMADDSDASRAALAAARGLMADVRLIDEGETPLAKSIHMEMVYVVQGDQIWQTSDLEQGRGQSGFVIRKGPQWEPRSFVDIFLRITDGKGVPFLLVVKHQPINVVE